MCVHRHAHICAPHTFLCELSLKIPYCVPGIIRGVSPLPDFFFFFNPLDDLLKEASLCPFRREWRAP